MSIAFALLLAASQAAPAPAPDWRVLGPSADRSRISYDGNRIERDADQVTIWLKTEQPPWSLEALWAVSRTEIRCAARTVRVVETVTHRADGSIIGTDTRPMPFAAIPPESVIELARRDVC